VGALIFAFALVGSFTPKLRIVNVALAGWLFLATLFLGGSIMTILHNLLVGGVLVALSMVPTKSPGA
jgi:hypothetical protein